MSTATSPAPVVAGFGAVAVDQIINVDEPYVVGKGRVIDRQTSYGGNAATALAAAAKLGANARFIGYLPDSTEWADVYTDLEKHHIDVTNATSMAGAAPVQAFILLTPDGERFVAFDDNTAIGPPADLDLALVTSANVLLIDAYSPMRSTSFGTQTDQQSLSPTEPTGHGSRHQTRELSNTCRLSTLPSSTPTVAATCSTAYTPCRSRNDSPC